MHLVELRPRRCRRAAWTSCSQAASALRHAVDLDERPLYGFESHPLRHTLLISKALLAVFIFRIQIRMQG